MNVQEPMTLATDYLLTIAAAIFGARLWRTNRMWALAFFFTAAGSFLGGTNHGFAQVIGPFPAAVLWKLTILSIGLASFFLLAGTSRKLVLLAIVKFIVYASWMITHDQFLWVIIDYGVTLLIVGIAMLVKRGPSTPWVIASIVVSVIGAGVQQSGFDLHKHFNHNDLYHVIQLFALWLLYRGGMLMSRSTEQPSTRPT